MQITNFQKYIDLQRKIQEQHYFWLDGTEEGAAKVNEFLSQISYKLAKDVLMEYKANRISNPSEVDEFYCKYGGEIDSQGNIVQAGYFVLYDVDLNALIKDLNEDLKVYSENTKNDVACRLLNNEGIRRVAVQFHYLCEKMNDITKQICDEIGLIAKIDNPYENSLLKEMLGDENVAKKYLDFCKTQRNDKEKILLLHRLSKGRLPKGFDEKTAYEHLKNVIPLKTGERNFQYYFSYSKESELLSDELLRKFNEKAG